MPPSSSRARPRLRRAAAWMAAAALTACAPPRPDEPDLAGPALERLYADAAQAIASGGGLRTEKAPADAPLSIPGLVRNFERIAFFSEFDGTSRAARSSPIPLTRWEGPVRVGVIFGDSVPAAQRRRDLADVEDLLARFRAATGRDIRYLPEGGVNFIVLVLAREEQKALAAELAGADPYLDALAEELWFSRPSLLCSASLFGPEEPGRGIALAVTLIKAEHRDLMRRSCFHEEMTQAMGLLNDSPVARPSIFNDDEEFALLTTHDELLLRMLYDPRLRVGMTAEEARPLLRQIAIDAVRAAGLRLG